MPVSDYESTMPSREELYARLKARRAAGMDERRMKARAMLEQNPMIQEADRISKEMAPQEPMQDRVMAPSGDMDDYRARQEAEMQSRVMVPSGPAMPEEQPRDRVMQPSGDMMAYRDQMGGSMATMKPSGNMDDYRKIQGARLAKLEQMKREGRVDPRIYELLARGGGG